MESYFYQKLEFSKWNPPATPEQIREAERRLGGEFPRDYRDFLVSLDGGLIRTDPTFVASTHRGEPTEYVLKVLLGVMPYDGGSLFHQLRGFDFTERVPGLIIPIGILEVSYEICLSLRSEDYGHIYLWGPRHLWPTDDDLPNKKSMKDLFFLANSFTEFLAILKF